ncbi:MAG: radical SAM protein [Oligoflexia bacterium]|nr:radical SAM protein [Oligoflexia bacterium]
MNTQKKTISKYKLNNSVIIRVEKDTYLIYDRKSKKLLESDIDPNAYLEDWNNLETDDTTAIKILIDNELVSKISSANSANSANSVNLEDKFIVDDSDGISFMSLRSEINPFWILWEITPKCNLRCIYCLPKHKGTEQEILENKHELTTNELLNIASQIVDAQVFDVTITGGEALLSPSLWPVLEFLNKNGVQCNLLSNGTIINDNLAQKLSTYQITVSVSIDSNKEEINAITRGDNVLERTIRGIDCLKKYNVPVNIICTVNKYNFDYLEELFSWSKSYGIDKMVLQDLRPFKDSELYNSLRLTLSQEGKLRDKLESLTNQYKTYLSSTCELGIFHHRLQPIENQKVMDCPSGDHTAYLDHAGNLYPCNSLISFLMGNVLKENITYLWQKSPAIIKLRKLKNQDVSTIHSCSGCPSTDVCGRGCRGDAELTDGDFLGRPSRCSQKMNEL